METVDVKKNEEVYIIERDVSINIQANKKEIKAKMWNNWKNNKMLLKLKNKEKGNFACPTRMETELQKVQKTKIIETLKTQERKRYSKVIVPISFTTLTSLSLQTKQHIVDMEKKMSQFDHDCLMQLTARNDLETYVLNA